MTGSSMLPYGKDEKLASAGKGVQRKNGSVKPLVSEKKSKEFAGG